MAPPTQPSGPSNTSNPGNLMLSSACTDAQRSGYLECAVATVGAIQDAVAILTGRQVLPDLGSDERRLITVELAELKAREAKVWANMHAFIAGQQAVRPPVQADLDKVKALAKKLDTLTAQATMTKAVLEATTEIVVLYNRSIDL
jgi:predicted hotdog family 3-hydroxylacyl-ACP dehydratase